VSGHLEADMSSADIPEDTDMSTITAGTTDITATEHISGLRERLDEIDARIIELWQERAAISQEVGRTRVASGGTRLVLNRENEILERYRAQLGPDGVQLALLILRAGRGPL
jgi:chorismate mutase